MAKEKRIKIEEADAAVCRFISGSIYYILSCSSTENHTAGGSYHAVIIFSYAGQPDVKMEPKIKGHRDQDDRERIQRKRADRDVIAVQSKI